MMAWFGVEHWPDDGAIPSTRQQVLERASVCCLRGDVEIAGLWLAIAYAERGDSSDELDLGGES